MEKAVLSILPGKNPRGTMFPAYTPWKRIANLPVELRIRNGSGNSNRSHSGRGGNLVPPLTAAAGLLVAIPRGNCLPPMRIRGFFDRSGRSTFGPLRGIVEE